MKILEIIPQLGSGGGERFVIDICNEFTKKNNVELVYFYQNEASEFYKEELSPQVNTCVIDKQRGFDISLIHKLRKHIIHTKPDIVHSHLNALPYVLFATWGIKNIKVFHTVHNDAQKEAENFINTLARKFAFKSRRITPITISKSSELSFERFYKMSAPLIYNGRNVNPLLPVSDNVKEEFITFRRTTKTKVLVNIAHIDDVKHQDMLVRCVKELTNEGYDISLLLIGRISSMETYSRIEADKGENVYILGEKRNPLEYLKMSDAFCLCSRYEGLPISLLEAMGLGIPAICTPVGGIVDVIEDGKNGFLSAGIRKEDYLNSLRIFLDSSETSINLMKSRIRKTYEPFTMCKCAEEYLKLFSNTM